MFRLRPSDKTIISRSGLFDPQFYSNANPDVATDGRDPLDHYLKSGRKEGRKPSAEFDPRAYLEANPDLDPATEDPLLHYILRGKKEGRPLSIRIPPIRRFPIEQVTGMAPSALQEDSLANYYKQLKAVLQFHPFAQKFQLIQDVEKEVASERWTRVHIPPSNDPRYFIHRAFRQRLPKTHYDTVIFLPSVSLEKGKTISTHLVDILSRTRPHETILIIKTYGRKNSRPDEVTSNVDLLDISDLIPLMPGDAFAGIFLAMLWGLSTRRVINIASPFFFNICERFSRQLSRYVYLYSYWNESTSHQIKSSSTFLQLCFLHLDAILMESDRDAAQLIDQYAIPESYRHKIIHLTGDCELQLTKLFKSEEPKTPLSTPSNDIAPTNVIEHQTANVSVRVKPAVDISAILTLHKEGLLCGPTLVNFYHAIQFARNAGLSVEGLIMCDRSDHLTEALAQQPQFKTFRVEATDFGDAGLSRNAAIRLSSGNQIAFLDGDDFWCEDWLVACRQYMTKLAHTCILHSAFNLFFGKAPWIMVHPDSMDLAFDRDSLRLANCWTSSCFASRDIWLHHPYIPSDSKSGFGYEDWSWNCQTLAEGIHHRPCPETFHVIREKQFSLSTAHNSQDVVPWPTKLTLYD